MIQIKFKKRYDIRRCPKCKKGEMHNLQEFRLKGKPRDHNKGLYVCNNCSHYYLIGTQKRSIVLWIVFLLIFVFLMKTTGKGLDFHAMVIFSILGLALIYDLRKYIRLNRDYHVIRRVTKMLEPNEKQLEGIKKHEFDKALGGILSPFGALFS